MIQFNDNGAWCWFQDPRVVIDTKNNTMLLASVANSEGPDDKNRTGDIDVVSYNLRTAATQRFVLHHNLLQEDDHNCPALLIRPDGRYVAMYSRHNKDALTYWRVSTKPHDATAWDEEQTFDWKPHLSPAGEHITYSNLFYLSSEDRTYDFTRAVNLDPSILTSNDHGSTWQYAGKLLTIPRLGYVNGYVKYASNSVDRIDFVTTEHHPRDFSNNIYHGYIQNGKLHRSDGTVIDENVLASTGRPQSELTKIFSAGSVYNGVTMSHAWIADIRVDHTGHPYAILTARANDIPDNTNFNDHRFFYAHFDGNQWNVHELAKAGACLWPAEQDYTGLGALNPNDPNVVYISTPIDPRSDAKLLVHEIFKGVTADGGATWNWTAVTQNSPVDNLRPVVPIWDSKQTAVLWFRGTMSRSQHYNSAIVGVIQSHDEPATP